MRLFLYGRPAVLALATAAALIEKQGHTAQYRRDGLFQPDQTEPCDAVVVQLGLDTTGPIAEAYTAKEVPVFGVPLDEYVPTVIRSGGFRGLAQFVGYDLGPVLEELDAAEQNAAANAEDSRAQLAAIAEQRAADETAAARSGSEVVPDAAPVGSSGEPATSGGEPNAPNGGTRSEPATEPAPSTEGSSETPRSEPDAGSPAPAPAAAVPAPASRRRGGK